jgi:ubiquitin C-terminal hydrolase
MILRNKLVINNQCLNSYLTQNRLKKVMMIQGLLNEGRESNPANKYEEPEKLLDELARLNPSFRSRAQEDAQEFLFTLLQSLALENETTIKLFEGTLQNIIECSNCHRQSINEEPIYNLPLPLEKPLEKNNDDSRRRKKKHRADKSNVVQQHNQSLDSCLQSFNKPGLIEEYFCGTFMSNTSAMKQVIISKFPSTVLLIYLQRF